MAEQTDEELWQAYTCGLEAAFEELFKRHKGKVFNFSLRMLKERQDAEDITSEVFTQLFQKRYVDNGKAKLTTWLFTVARNACISRLRSIKFRIPLWFEKNDEGNFVPWDIADPGDSALDILNEAERSRQVRQAIDQLPHEQKEALILREYFDKEYSQIAQIMGCSLAKVKVLIFRGRETLQVILSPMTKGDM